MLALSATNQFHNNVNRSITRAKSMPKNKFITNSCASMTSLRHLIVGKTTYPTDHPLIVGTTTKVLINHHPTIGTTSNPTKQVARTSKNTEGDTTFSFF